MFYGCCVYIVREGYGGKRWKQKAVRESHVAGLIE